MATKPSNYAVYNRMTGAVLRDGYSNYGLAHLAARQAGPLYSVKEL